jgi:DNA-directed RNA polymerase subunit RPC12/RpoP
VVDKLPEDWPVAKIALGEALQAANVEGNLADLVERLLRWRDEEFRSATIQTMVIIDPENQCPHCATRLAEEEKEQNFCQSCEKELWEEVVCPYCGRRQQFKGAGACLECRRRIPSDLQKRQRLSWLRIQRRIDPHHLDRVLREIENNPVQLRKLDKEVAAGPTRFRCS